MPAPAQLPMIPQARSTTAKTDEGGPPSPTLLDREELRRLCLDAGADDVGFVDMDRPEIADQRADILRVFPKARTLVSFVCRMNREPIRSPARSIANLEFHAVGDRTDEAARRIVARLESRGLRALNPAMGFPMEMDRFPGKIWVVSHKPVAVAAGLGHLGIHRNVIHPIFGNFILLGTVVTEAGITGTDRPLEENPCLQCKLCVAACPVGAIAADGAFNFSACYTHNYREFMGGFTDWVETVVESRDGAAYRRRVDDSESASMWQSLSYGANYKAAYCMAVCPAGAEVLGPFRADRKGYVGEIVKPLQAKTEPVYVLPGSDAERHVARRFPWKQPRRVRNSLRPRSVRGFLEGLPLVFQRDRAKGLTARYHFTFTGRERHQATVVIRDRTLEVLEGLAGPADLRVTADAEFWLGFLRRERALLWGILRRKVRLSGSIRALQAFGRCVPR